MKYVATMAGGASTVPIGEFDSTPRFRLVEGLELCFCLLVNDRIFQTDRGRQYWPDTSVLAVERVLQHRVAVITHREQRLVMKCFPACDSSTLREVFVRMLSFGGVGATPPGQLFGALMPRDFDQRAEPRVLAYAAIDHLDSARYDVLGDLPWDGEQCWTQVTRLAQELERLHDLGLAHLDIKPSNILTRPDVDVSFIDFGSVRALDPARAADHGAAWLLQSYGSTEGFRAPEDDGEMAACSRREMISRDLHQLGVVAAILITGLRDPWQARDTLSRGRTPDGFIELDSVMAKVRGWYARDPHERPSSMKEANDQLEELGERHPGHVEVSPSVEGLAILVSHLDALMPFMHEDVDQAIATCCYVAQGTHASLGAFLDDPDAGRLLGPALAIGCIFGVVVHAWARDRGGASSRSAANLRMALNQLEQRAPVVTAYLERSLDSQDPADRTAVGALAACVMEFRPVRILAADYNKDAILGRATALVDFASKHETLLDLCTTVRWWARVVEAYLASLVRDAAGSRGPAAEISISRHFRWLLMHPHHVAALLGRPPWEDLFGLLTSDIWDSPNIAEMAAIAWVLKTLDDPCAANRQAVADRLVSGAEPSSHAEVRRICSEATPENVAELILRFIGWIDASDRGGWYTRAWLAERPNTLGPVAAMDSLEGIV